VVLDVNVLGALVELWVLGQRQASLIIAFNDDWVEAFVVSEASE
jgi:hypothetical protein